ncbi:hypothetical protein [Streptomyces pinistramenti]|uniref:hypothetical protein n=1 Tax=Streptomyces pinistramenti TaxID=2884812 RepID=UPI001D0996BF|nr:hypothetical protein [Streptomyces pinistramenti]MCB5911278.1 hypothetical protein [Streptomyces pinistramenti]
MGRRLREHLRHALVVGVVTAVVGALAPLVLPPLFQDPPPACPGAPAVQPVLRGRAGPARQGGARRMVTVQVTGGSSRGASVDYGTEKFTDVATVGTTFRVRFCAVPSTHPNRRGKWVRYCYEATERSAWE